MHLGRLDGSDVIYDTRDGISAGDSIIRFGQGISAADVQGWLMFFGLICIVVGWLCAFEGLAKIAYQRGWFQ